MNGLIGRFVLGGFLAVSVAALAGCGSSGSSNDQGVAFSLNEFYTDSTATTGRVGYVSPFGALIATSAVQLQNNLIGQGIRVRRLFLSYNIPGSGISLPSTSVGLTSTLGPVECAAGPNVPECVDTTLPAAFKTNNISNSEFRPVPAAVNEYLILNRDSLPALPFSLEITIVAEGVTTSGDTLQSNAGVLNVEYIDDSGIAEPAPVAE
jgi:hypothetical protein